MAIEGSSLSAQELLGVLTAIDRGDFSKTLATGGEGVDGEIASRMNSIVSKLRNVSGEVNRITIEMGVEGRFGGQCEAPDVEGEWKRMVSNVNTMAQNLTIQMRSIALMVTAIANGDLQRVLTIEHRGCRRNSRAETDDQHDGRDAEHFRR
jgi:osomolarity two-component system, sensor histidine kinase NIK1